MARVVVVGGGISGLAAAHRLSELARARGVPCAITLLEARDRLGGVIETRAQDGVLLESGPDAFLTEKPWAVELCRRLGIADELLETQPASRRSFIVHHGRLVAVPEGWYLIAPSRLATIFRSPLLSWAGKLRMACEPMIPPLRVARDESLGRFITRRFGREALERIGQPMIAGIYVADPDRLSLLATMPKLAEMERRHGSVIRALRGAAREPNAPTASASGPRYSLFMSLREGMQRLVDALLGAMPEVSVRLGAAVRRIAPGPSWTVELQDGSQLEAEGLCLALPAPQAAALVAPFAPEMAEELARISYESVATVNMAFRASEVPRPLEGFGFVVPAIERRRIVGCTFASMKFAGRAPERSALVRAFVGGALHREPFALDDRAMTAMVREELADLLGIRAEPFLASVHRHPGAMPQYEVGHLDLVAAIEAKTARYPGLALTGNGYRGMGIPDCIHQAEEAAARLMARLNVLQ